jgi:acetylornithine deacetylase
MSHTLEILDRLIRFNSVSANSNFPIIDYIEEFLRARGFAVHQLPDETGQKAGIFASLGPAGPGMIFLWRAGWHSVGLCDGAEQLVPGLV